MSKMGINKDNKMYGFTTAHMSAAWKAKRSQEVALELARSDSAAQSVEYAELNNELSELSEQNEESPLDGGWLSRLRPRREPEQTEARPSEPVFQVASGIKWQTLRHNGPLFAPDYQRLPNSVMFYYDHCSIELTEQAEEVATFYAKLLDTCYVRSHNFNKNFFSNFRSCLTEEQRCQIVKFELCDFGDIFEHFNWLKTEALASDLANNTKKLEQEKYGYCFVDGVRRQISEFRIRPPGLIQKNNLTMGLISPRVLPEDIIINCDENGNPPTPPLGHRWKQVVHDHRVNWLYSWVDPCTGRTCHVRPNNLGYRTPSRIQLETARRLQQHLAQIRNDYRRCWGTDDWFLRQRSVALYCIDQLAMGSAGAAGDQELDLCALRVKQLKMNVGHGKHGERMFKLLMEDCKERMYIVHPDIRFNLAAFVAGKADEELVFDELQPQQLEQHLDELMDGLTTQIFRICNASCRLEQYLDKLSPREPVCKQLQGYNSALRQIHAWCTHLPCSGADNRTLLPRSRQRYRSLENSRLQLLAQQTKDLVKATFPYLDPRITIAWCLRGNIPFHMVCDSVQLRRSLQWALKSTKKNFRF